ncbi:MAG: cytochrome c family protein [Alphaproteobacteria bacterium]|nr:cytochrome c family protein [Alphaproteobacteria bacterium]
MFPMDGFELNKIVASILLTLVIGMASSLISDALVTPKPLLHNVYIVPGVKKNELLSASTLENDPPPIEPLLATANVENGAKIAKKCVQCHSLEKGGANRIGPNLWGIIKNKMAHAIGFPYSKGLEAKKDTWTFENLNHFIYKPRGFIAGTKMSFAGLGKAQDRADLIAYLNTLSDVPQPLPSSTQESKKNSKKDIHSKSENINQP